MADPPFLAAIDGAYPAGTPVELAGYAKPLRSAVSPAVAALPEPIGPFRVAYVSGVDRRARTRAATTSRTTRAATSSVTGLDGQSSSGHGHRGRASRCSGTGAGSLSEAFHQNGGYAALMQLELDWYGPDSSSPARPVYSPAVHQHPRGRIGGVEIIRYSSFDGTTAPDRPARGRPGHRRRPGSAARLRQRLDQTSSSTAGSGDWLRSEVFVVPISIPIGAVSSDFPSSYPERHSEFAQITHVEGDLELTEWVRYDSVANGHLVRHASEALQSLGYALRLGDVTTGDGGSERRRPPPPPPGGGGRWHRPEALLRRARRARPRRRARPPPAQSGSQGAPLLGPVPRRGGTGRGGCGGFARRCLASSSSAASSGPTSTTTAPAFPCCRRSASTPEKNPMPAGPAARTRCCSSTGIPKTWAGPA